MTNATEDFYNEEHPRFGTNLLTPPILIPYSSAILQQYFNNMF